MGARQVGRTTATVSKERGSLVTLQHIIGFALLFTPVLVLAAAASWKDGWAGVVAGLLSFLIIVAVIAAVLYGAALLVL